MILAIICEKIALNKPHIVQVTAHIRKRITQIPTADEPEMQKKTIQRMIQSNARSNAEFVHQMNNTLRQWQRFQVDFHKECLHFAIFSSLSLPTPFNANRLFVVSVISTAK